jgi:hypothetical protein
VDITFQKCYLQYEYRFDTPDQTMPRKKKPEKSTRKAASSQSWRAASESRSNVEADANRENCEFFPFELDSPDVETENAEERVVSNVDDAATIQTARQIVNVDSESATGNINVNTSESSLASSVLEDESSLGRSFGVDSSKQPRQASSGDQSLPSILENVLLTPSDLKLPSKMRQGLLFRFFGFSANDMKVCFGNTFSILFHLFVFIYNCVGILLIC